MLLNIYRGHDQICCHLQTARIEVTSQQRLYDKLTFQPLTDSGTRGRDPPNTSTQNVYMGGGGGAKTFMFCVCTKCMTHMRNIASNYSPVICIMTFVLFGVL